MYTADTNIPNICCCLAGMQKLYKIKHYFGHNGTFRISYSILYQFQKKKKKKTQNSLIVTVARVIITYINFFFISKIKKLLRTFFFCISFIFYSRCKRMVTDDEFISKKHINIHTIITEGMRLVELISIFLI